MNYNAKAGRLKFSQRLEINGRWEKQEEDVSFQQPAFVADMENIQVGWLFFKAVTTANEEAERQDKVSRVF